jgi:hypothetical protein
MDRGRAAAGRLPTDYRTTAGRLPDALDPGFHSVRTRWIRGFMMFRLAWRTRIVRLMVPV